MAQNANKANSPTRTSSELEEDTRLPEYHALQSTLAERADGPRGVKNVKGKKKDWIKAHIFEDFKNSTLWLLEVQHWTPCLRCDPFVYLMPGPLPVVAELKKRVRLAEPQPNDLSLSPPNVTIASANATTTTKTKETAPTSRGAKRGLKSKAGATTSSRPKSSVLGADLDEKKEKKKPAAKSSKPLPPRQASKRYAALDIFI
jgi:hypothetical protein